MKTLFLIFTLLFLSLSTRGAPPEVTVVVGPEPTKLEKYASEELAAQLEVLYEAEVTIAKSAPSDVSNVILLGSPQTNPAIAQSDWPDSLSDQGHVLRSTERGLIVGGGSSVATLWAVYELGHSFGIRYLLHGDFQPIAKPEFSLAGYDSVLEPGIEIRAWRTIDTGAAGQESWGLADHEKLLRQLAKLKFNRVTMVIRDDQPFEDSTGNKEHKKPGGVLWGGKEFSVSGDTAGRSVFGGAKVFENPDFAGKTTSQERSMAALTLQMGIRSTAQDLGMTTTIEENGVEDPEIVILPLGQSRGGMLPQFSTSTLPSKLDGAREVGGFAVKCWIPGDLNPDVYFLSRVSFDKKVTPEGSLESLVTPICGEGVIDRLATGFAAIEEVSALIEKEDADFAKPDPLMFMEHYNSGEPIPEWWAKAKEQYGVAVNEMYRANTRARGGARPFILYHAKRFTFALHYMTAIEHARLAGIAREAKDNEAWVENLELAVEAMHNALGIYAEVVRDNSDRGVIAVLNEYAYRPLVEALNETPLP